MAPARKEPVYLQLHHQLQQLITEGEFPPGARFLTERRVSERFGISRPTANKALSTMVSAGLLEFRKGVGTFTRARALGYNLRSLVSFTEEARAAGKQPATEVLRFERSPLSAAPAEVCARLQLGPKATVYFMERLRLADDAPVILERRWVTASRCPGLKLADLAGSLYQLWTTRFKLDLEGADESLRAVSLAGPDAALLKVPEGSAGLLIGSVGYLSGGTPLWVERTLYRGDSYEFHNRLGRLQSAAQASGRFLDPL